MTSGPTSVRRVGWNAPAKSSSTEMARADVKYHSLSCRIGPPSAGLMSWMLVTPWFEVSPRSWICCVKLSACQLSFSVKPM